jgi:hypothetical protein
MANNTREIMRNGNVRTAAMEHLRSLWIKTATVLSRLLYNLAESVVWLCRYPRNGIEIGVKALLVLVAAIILGCVSLRALDPSVQLSLTQEQIYSKYFGVRGSVVTKSGELHLFANPESSRFVQEHIYSVAKSIESPGWNFASFNHNEIPPSQAYQVLFEYFHVFRLVYISENGPDKFTATGRTARATSGLYCWFEWEKGAIHFDSPKSLHKQCTGITSGLTKDTFIVSCVKNDVLDFNASIDIVQPLGRGSALLRTITDSSKLPTLVYPVSLARSRHELYIAEAMNNRVFCIDIETGELLFVVETVRTVKNILDHWRIESIIL